MDPITEINAYESLKKNRGWKRLVEINEANIKIMERQIVDKADEEGNPLGEEEMDKLRDKIGYLKELSNLPDEMIKDIKAKMEVKVENNDGDPYE